MKRSRDDAYASSQLKRPMGSSRGDSYGQSQTSGGGLGGGGDGAVNPQALTTNDALTYLKEVKDMFHDQREKYDLFLEVMKDFKAQRTDTTGVIARVKELFKGHNNLIFGFNTFLPKGFEITLDDVEAPPKKTVEFDEAISFVNKIKRRFLNDEHVYKSFLDILNMYHKEHKDIAEVYSEVATLFEDHSDLLDEFTRFLPDASATPSTQHAPYGRNSFLRSPMMRPMQVDKHRYRRDRDPSVDRPELDDDKALMKSHKEQRKRVDKESRDRKIRDHDDRVHDHDNIRDIKSRFFEKKIAGKKAENFGLTTDFSSYDDKDTLKSMYNQAFSFCEKVKEKLGSSDDYQAFLKCLHIFSNGIIKRNDLQNLVTDLLGKYPDLMDEFNEFLERCENIDGFLAGVISKKSLGADGQLSRTLKLEDKDKEQKRETNGSKDKERYREKYWGKSIQELDLSNCQLCTPSYRHLPEDYPIPVASQRSELGAQVLNDHWVSVTSGSEDYSFKHMRRNQYEESLFRCEDDRFELDMLLESVSSASKCAEDLYNKINEKKINMEAPICIEDHFSALNLRCIERLYGDHGLDVMDILRRNPAHALPVILTRLKQKQEEWSRCRSDFNKVWADIYTKNHYKSLDHRSFYFKQQDSKNLSTKSLVAEIKEKKAKQHKELDILQAIAGGNKQRRIPNLELKYSDVGILEDMYKLIRDSCEEVFPSKDMSNKIMKLWTTFLEMILGVPSRTQGIENVEDRKTGQHVAHFAAPNTGDGNSHEDLAKSDNEGDGRVNEVNSGQQISLAANDRENGPVDGDEACRDDPLTDKGKNNSDCGEKIPGSCKQISSVEQSTINNTSVAVRRETSMTKTSLEITSGSVLNPARQATTLGSDGGVAISQGGSGPMMQGRDIAPPVPLANGALKESTKGKSHEESAELYKAEKEEGELSPNADSEEDNFVGYGQSSGQALPKSKHNIERENYKSRNADEECCPEAGGDNGADADDEDSDNVSEVGEDASGSESAGDACSREEHEEDEDIERDDVEGKAESEGEAEGLCDAQSAGGEGASLPLSERFLLSVKPLTKRVSAVSYDEERKNSRIFYGNDDFFVLFRLHHILYERISLAKQYSMSAETKWKTTKEASSPDPYSRFMNALYNLLDGSAENVKFEDECRAIIGNQSYILFTLDKLIYKLVRQLQTVLTDEIDNKLLQLYEYEKSRKPGRFIDSVYYANARVILHDDNIYRFESYKRISPSPVFVQLMDNMIEKPEAVSVDPNFSFYLYNDVLSISPGKREPHGMILQRNKRKYGDPDEPTSMCLAMEGVKLANGLDCKIACNSSKVSYVMDTEDYFFRPKRQRTSSSGTSSSQHHRDRQERFLRFLSAS